MTDQEPQGIVATLIDPDGRVCGSATDFERSGYGGFKLWEAQKMRAKKRACSDFINRYASSILAEAIFRSGLYGPEELVNWLRNEKGWRMHYTAVGHDDCDPNN